jgi:hypothetical protein
MTHTRDRLWWRLSFRSNAGPNLPHTTLLKFPRLFADLPGDASVGLSSHGVSPGFRDQDENSRAAAAEIDFESVESASSAALYWMCASGRIRSAGRTEVHLTTI